MHRYESSACSDKETILCGTYGSKRTHLCHACSRKAWHNIIMTCICEFDRLHMMFSTSRFPNTSSCVHTSRFPNTSSCVHTSSCSHTTHICYASILLAHTAIYYFFHPVLEGFVCSHSWYPAPFLHLSNNVHHPPESPSKCR